MKKIILVLMILFIWLVFLQAGFPASLQEPVKGKIKVVNVEVPVRVFYKNQPVNNLTVDVKDFLTGKLVRKDIVEVIK